MNNVSRREIEEPIVEPSAVASPTKDRVTITQMGAGSRRCDAVNPSSQRICPGPLPLEVIQGQDHGTGYDNPRRKRSTRADTPSRSTPSPSASGEANPRAPHAPHPPGTHPAATGGAEDRRAPECGSPAGPQSPAEGSTQAGPTTHRPAADPSPADSARRVTSSSTSRVQPTPSRPSTNTMPPRPRSAPSTSSRSRWNLVPAHERLGEGGRHGDGR